MKTETSTTRDSAKDRRALWVFTPSRTDPKDLEFILVQRQKLLQDAVERVKESALTDHKHYLLFVAPRGCGKTHLVTLIVNRLVADAELADHLRIAWLNEDETCTTLLEFLLKIHGALEKRYPKEFRGEMLSAAYDMKPDAAMDFTSKQLLESLGSRTLLVVTENLDAIFEGLGDSGQKQLRSFIQENPKLCIVATAQRLVQDLTDRARPFFGFFQTEHLRPLNVEQATELLQNIARLQGNLSVVEFLSTSRGRSRVRAMHHLSGGNHRIYIVLSQFITRNSVDALIDPFMKMVDELTPYYQERIRWLPPLQRKIVEYLCNCEGTVPVKEIAKRLFATPQTISSQLQDLREKGYVGAKQRGRESLYEISEVLMRICVEVKDNQRNQPLRLLVDFLRVWYDENELEDRLGQMVPGTAARIYLDRAIQQNLANGSLRKQLLLEELQWVSPDNVPLEIRQGKFQELKNIPEAMLLAIKSLREGNPAEAIAGLDEAIDAAFVDVEKADLLLYRGNLHSSSGELGKAIDDYTVVVSLPGVHVEQLTHGLFNRGLIYGQKGDRQNEIEDYTAVVNKQGSRVELRAKALLNRGVTQGHTGNTQQALDDFTAVINLPDVTDDHLAMALFNRGVAHFKSGEMKSAIDDFTAVLGLPGVPVNQRANTLHNRGFTHRQLGDMERAIDDFNAAITLPGAPAETVVRARFNRGLTHIQSGDTQRSIDDFAAVIEQPGASVGLIARALFFRGATHFNHSRKAEAHADFTDLVRLADAPLEQLVDAHLALSELHLGEGRWTEGFQSLESSLECGTRVQPAYRPSPTGLVGTLFTAGLNPEGRRDKATQLLRIYGAHQALAVLGEAAVQHIGRVFRAGMPFPSTDNLEGWASVWEHAAESVPDFRLSMRLLRTGIDFVKAGGKDPGILFVLTSTERAILEQALGLAGDGDSESK